MGSHMVVSATPCNHETADTMPARRKPSEPQGAGAPPRSAPRNARREGVRRNRNTLPARNKTIGDRLNRTPSRNETIRPRNRVLSRTLRQRLPNRWARGDRLALPAAPQRAAHHPEHAIERGNHDGQTGPEQNNARIDNQLHYEAHGAGARTTTARKPALGAHSTRVVERTRKRNTVTETHFRSNLSY